VRDKEVTEYRFWEAIGKLNVRPMPIGAYPWISSFRMNGVEYGRIEPCCPCCNEGRSYRYFLSDIATC
jgi:hypothetical protein